MAWHQAQAITWTNTDLSSVGPCIIHLKIIALREVLMNTNEFENYTFKIWVICLMGQWAKWPLAILYNPIGGFELFSPSLSVLTHWGQVTNICVSNLTTNGSDKGLSPTRRQAIIWTNADMLWIGPIGTNFNEIWIESHAFSFTKIHLKMSSGKWRPFCLSLNVLTFAVKNIRKKKKDILACSFNTKNMAETIKIPPLRRQNQYHGCWWPGDPRSQGNSSLNVDLIILE